MKQIAVFASGTGSNTARIIDHFRHHPAIKVALVVCNKPGAGVLDFTKITVPHSQGYRISLELIGGYFRIYAVPARYNRTGRLSFLTDNTLSVRASDRAGQQATSEDAEYKGEEH